MVVYPVRISHKEQAEKLVQRVGVEKEAVPILAPKTISKNIVLKSVKTSWANIIKQEMLSCGGDAAVSNKTYNCSIPFTDVVLMGSSSCYQRFINRMKMQPECFIPLVKEIEEVVYDHVPALKIAGVTYDLSKEFLIFGVLNVTPDSFSDGGKYFNYDDAFRKAEELLKQGATFIDIGGESARPGSQRVTLQEEQERVLPLIESVTRRFGSVVSVDSYKPELLREALKVGAKVVNDINNGASVKTISQDIIDYDAASIVMMNRSESDLAGSVSDSNSADTVGEFIDFCHQTRAKLLELGIKKNSIIMDPGIGFGLSDSDVNCMLNNAYSLSGSGFPMCWGISRKSFMGRTVGVALNQRDQLSNAISLYLLSQGVKIFRSHDVAGLNVVIKFYKNLEGVVS